MVMFPTPGLLKPDYREDHSQGMLGLEAQQVRLRKQC